MCTCTPAFFFAPPLEFRLQPAPVEVARRVGSRGMLENRTTTVNRRRLKPELQRRALTNLRQFAKLECSTIDRRFFQRNIVMESAAKPPVLNKYSSRITQ